MNKTRTKKPKTNASRDMARLIAQAACDTKAKEIAVLDLSKISGFTDYFVIASGTSDRQVQAICDNILASAASLSLRVEGEGQSRPSNTPRNGTSRSTVPFDMKARCNTYLVHPLGVEGYQKGHWILIDFGSVIAHVFYEEVRDFYALEKLWGDAPRVRFRLK